MRIAHIASEVAPWSQTGGLADVVGSVPAALERVGGSDVECAVFSPFYRGIRQKAQACGATIESTDITVAVDLAGWRVVGRLYRLQQSDHPPVYLIDYPGFYERDGIYCSSTGADHADNHLRFAFLCRAAIEAAPRIMGGVPDVFHGHDWQAGLVPVYLRTRYPQLRSASVFTIHNLAYQGVFHKNALEQIGLDWSVFTLDRLEYHDWLSYLKGGVAYADALTTVSPSYAYEIQTPAFGHGLDIFVRSQARRVHGILNGIDTEAWDPATDSEIAANYDDDTLPEGKAACRRALADEFHLKLDEDEILLGVVSRFTGQKGLDLVADVVPDLHAMAAKLIVLGSGDLGLEDRFRYLGHVFGGNASVRIGFDVAQSRRIYSGIDAILVPSRFEPCGLSQLYAMRYGTVPIVHAVGGLRDTVHDPGDSALCRGEGTGFRFEHPTAIGLRWAIDRAARIFRDRPAGWLAIARSGMGRDFSWDQSARAYLQLYQTLRR
ncbi:MAG: glycogen synthase GlgA [Proteobacteria bacterium]|nr:glycogen synthase GlgA [Pseudomonadota bacterium]